MLFDTTAQAARHPHAFHAGGAQRQIARLLRAEFAQWIVGIMQHAAYCIQCVVRSKQYTAYNASHDVAYLMACIRWHMVHIR